MEIHLHHHFQNTFDTGTQVQCKPTGPAIQLQVPNNSVRLRHHVAHGVWIAQSHVHKDTPHRGHRNTLNHDQTTSHDLDLVNWRSFLNGSSRRTVYSQEEKLYSGKQSNKQGLVKKALTKQKKQKVSGKLRWYLLCGITEQSDVSALCQYVCVSRFSHTYVFQTVSLRQAGR